MGDVAGGIKSFKKGMSDDTSINNKGDDSKSGSDPKTNNPNASNRMVRDFISSNNCNISFRPKEFPIALKIGSYIGKFKNTISNLKEVSNG